MMTRTSSTVIGLGIALVAAVVSGVASADTTGCQMVRIDEWPVRLVHNKLVVDGAINGHPVAILLDTGAMRTIVFRPAAVCLGLPLSPVFGAWVTGVGGDTRRESADVKEIRIGTATRNGWTMAVAGEQDLGDDVAVALGEDFFQNVDVEFDLAHRTVRLFKPVKCAGASLAYWAPDGAPTVPIESVNRDRPRIVVPVRINGQPVAAVLDSGAGTTVLNKRVASQLGLRPDTSGVVPAGTARGIGKDLAEIWVGPVDSFAIGSETIRTTTVPFGDLGDSMNMLLGVDFLLAHRLLVAHGQRKIYFTYIGGPIFQRTAATKDSMDAHSFKWVGASCQFSSECGGDLGCIASKCQRLASTSDQCKGHTECKADEWCIGSPRRCQARFAEGMACSKSTDCDGALKCQNDRCVQAK